MWRLTLILVFELFYLILVKWTTYWNLKKFTLKEEFEKGRALFLLWRSKCIHKLFLWKILSEFLLSKAVCDHKARFRRRDSTSKDERWLSPNFWSRHPWWDLPFCFGILLSVNGKILDMEEEALVAQKPKVNIINKFCKVLSKFSLLYGVVWWCRQYSFSRTMSK